jgi:hypothetical protein
MLAILIGAATVIGMILLVLVAQRRQRRDRGPKHISVDLMKKD